MAFGARSQADGTRERMVGSTDVCDDEWHHVVIRDNMDYPAAGGLCMYIDGSLEVEEDSTVQGSLLDTGSSDHIMIAYNEFTSNYSSFDFDELAIWNNHYLTDLEIATLYNSGSPPGESGVTHLMDSSIVG